MKDKNIGKKFKKLTVIKRAPDIVMKSGNYKAYLCECDCGKKITVRSSSLLNGSKKSCGCYRDLPKDNNIGKQFNFLTILDRGPDHVVKSGKFKTYLCKCECGNELFIRATYVINSKKRDCGCKKLLTKDKRAITRTLNRYKTSANERGYDFKLTRSEFEELIFSDCYYCGTEPSQKRIAGKSEIMINGVDRKNNKQGYTQKNCIPCCKVCNMMKSNLGYKDFLKHLKKIAINKGYKV